MPPLRFSSALPSSAIAFAQIVHIQSLPHPSLVRTGDDFLDMFNEMGLNSQVQEVPMGFTENASATYLSSGNACLDFFFHVVPYTLPAILIQLLQAAWNPLLVMNKAITGKLYEDLVVVD